MLPMKTPVVALLCLTLLLIAAPTAQAQSTSPGHQADVRAVIGELFDGMRAGDSTAVKETFAPSMRLMTVMPRNGEIAVLETPAERFLAAVGSPHEEVWDERIWDVRVRVDGPLATAWVPYAFYLGDDFSHCGVNAFQFARLSAGWKILQITDTRRTDCDVPADVQGG